MTQKDKELLLKDLCARLPYGVKAVLTRTNCRDYVNKVSEKDIYSFRTGRPLEEDYGQHDYYRVVVTDIKPYLFPLSSMTEEQYKEWCDLEGEPLDEILTRNANGEKMSTLEHHILIAKSLTDSVNYCYKNHFDIYGLIPMGLAIDATNLNIY